MKKYLAAIVFCLLIPINLFAYSLAWEYGTDVIGGFYIYHINAADYGLIEPQAVQIADPTARLWTLPSDLFIEGQTYLFWMTAYRESVESVKSETLEWLVPATVIIPDEIPTPYQLEMLK